MLKAHNFSSLEQFACMLHVAVFGNMSLIETHSQTANCYKFIIFGNIDRDCINFFCIYKNLCHKNLFVIE